MYYRTLSGVLLTVLVSATAAWAHHSYAATYNIDSQVRLEGRLVQVGLRNPHSYVYVQAKDENGDLQRWAVEWSGAGALARQGIAGDSLKIGDEIVITVNPSRAHGEYRGLMLTLRRPSDGLSWGEEEGQVVN